MQLKLTQLAAHLQRPLAPVYVLHGDEPLLQIEAARAIRDAATKAGFAERELLVADSGFDWQALAAVNQSMSLFGSRRILDLRIPTGKPGIEGARVLEAVGTSPSLDNVLLVSCPKLERGALSSNWFAALEGSGVAIAIPPLERDDLPAWIAERLSRNGQRATNEVLQYLADLTEGNLLAAQQEIDKLALLLPAGELTQEAIESVVANVARYDNGGLSEALLGADRVRVCRILAGLQAEGESVQLVLWQMADDTHALLAVAQALREGQRTDNALRNARVWGKRQAAMERAARRVDGRALSAMLPELARLDRISKGIGRGEVWDEVREYALRFIATLMPRGS
jgi:DNA polymerase-3 subunit delta